MKEDWINMGYSEQEAEELHQLCEKLEITGLCDIGYATESLAALIKSFDIDTDKVIDEWNKLGLN